jgi:hypothetical protein
MASPSPSPGDEAARVCLDILRGASQLAHPYAAPLSQLLREGREVELPWVEALVDCLAQVVANAKAHAEGACEESMMNTGDEGEVRGSEKQCGVE